MVRKIMIGSVEDIAANVASMGIVIMDITMDTLNEVPSWATVALVCSVIIFNLARAYYYIHKKK